jgi:hypothetical protein
MGIVDDELSRRAGIDAALPTPSTLLDRCSKNAPKLPFLPFFGPFGGTRRRDDSLGNTLQHHEIGHEPCSVGPSQNRVGIGASKRPHRIPRIVH